MLKSRFFYLRFIAVMFLLCLFLFTACQDSSDNNETSNNTGNSTGNTWIEFKNLEEFPVTIYSDPARQVVFAEIPANGTKKVSAEPAPMGRAFYPTFVLVYPIGTTINTNIPYNGPSITAAILENKTTTVSIPRLESITTNFAYIMLINNSSYSLTFNEGPLEKSPLGGGSSVINNGQNASYEITPKSVSSYSVLRNGSTPVAFPADLSEFKAGIIYVLTYNGTVLTATNQLPINTEITVPGNNLATKLAWLQSNILSNKSYFIEITADENIAPQSLSYSGKSGITIILNGGETMRTINLSSNGNLFEVCSGVTLILDKNITLKGKSYNNSSLVYIYGYGTLLMNEGSIITGNTNYSDSGYYKASGGGVYIGGNGVFIMNGGEISGNTASAFLPSSASWGWTPYSYGGGVYMISGTFTMNGGKISGNTASSASSYSSSDGSSYGGGVYVQSGTFIMSGGEISGNTSSSGYGGIYLYRGSFCMSGGVIYGYNAADSIKNSGYTLSYDKSTSYATATTQYGIFNGNTFYKSGDLTSTTTTIRVVNGNLLTE